MNALVAEWIGKAEGDYFTALREYRVRKHPNYDAVCFHAQQAAEKYLKAYLLERGISFPKTHSLVELLELCLTVDSSFEFYRDVLVSLERYAVQYRYPGPAADKDEARLAINSLKVIRLHLRNRLQLSAS
jgi:HEPN domain-containing protein